MAQRRRPFARSPAKASPTTSPASATRAPAAVASAAIALQASADPETSVEDIPLAKRKRSSGRQLLPTSPFATAQLASPHKPAASFQADDSAKSTVPSQQLTRARDSTHSAANTKHVSAVPCVSAGKPGMNREASAKVSSETATADKVAATSTAPQAKALQRSSSTLTAPGAEVSRHRVSNTQGKGEPQVELLQRPGSSVRLYEQRGSSKDGPSTSKGEAVRTLAGKDQNQPSGLKAVKGLPALSRKLSKKGGSSGLGGQAKGSDTNAAKVSLIADATATLASVVSFVSSANGSSASTACASA